MIHLLNAIDCRLEDFLDLSPWKRTELDLGCGSGGFSISLAGANPDTLVLAADVMLSRLRKVEKLKNRAGLKNLELLRVEARHLTGRILPDASLDRIHILCPDPWPKHKHKGNRLMSSEFMMSLRRILKPDGVLHFATDDPRYMNAALDNIVSSGLFEQLPPDALSDVASFKTEFEKDWLSIGRTVPHVAFRPAGN